MEHLETTSEVLREKLEAVQQYLNWINRNETREVILSE